MKEPVRVHLHISGLVQGVFFRAHTQEITSGLGLTGWVRNLFDDRVEIIAEGPKDSIEKLIQWCNQGPDGAMVEDVVVEWQDVTGEFKSFEIRYRF